MSSNYQAETVPGVVYIEDPSDLHTDLRAYDQLPPRIRKAVAAFPGPLESTLVLAAINEGLGEDALLREIARFREEYLAAAEAWAKKEEAV